MANQNKGEAELGAYCLVFDYNAICTLEVRTGLKLHALLMMMKTDLGFCDLRNFVWAGLRAKHEEITTEKAGEIIGEFGYQGSAEAVSKALDGFFAPQREEKVENPPLKE